MDSAQTSEPPEASGVSIIGPNIVINGNIESAGDTVEDVQIEGRVNGDVRCATVVLAENSAVRGNIQAQRVKVAGAVEGGIEAEELAIEGTAQITGDVVYEKIRIAAGAIVQGNLKWRAAASEVPESGKLKLVEAQAPPPPAKAVFIE
jgi:cytoskeletal protein CcmA (bactofilin family)